MSQPRTLQGDERHRVSARVERETARALERVASQAGLSRRAVVEAAILELADRVLPADEVA